MEIKRTIIPKKSGSGGGTTIINNGSGGGTIDTNNLNVNNLIASDINTNTLNATSGTIAHLESNSIDTATINVTGELNVVGPNGKANINELESDYAYIRGIDADSADITYLFVESIQGDTAELDAAQITELSSSTASISQLKDVQQITNEGGDIQITAADELNLSSTGDMDIESGGTLSLGATNGTQINGTLTTTGDVIMTTPTGENKKVVDMEDVEVRLGSDNSFHELTGDVGSSIISTNITTDYLTVLKSAHFFELIIDKIKASAGAVIFSAADGFKIDKVTSDNTYYTLYWRACQEVAEGTVGQTIAQTGQTLTEKVSVNMWQQWDQAICQTFNLSHGAGTYQDISNTYWWRVVADASDDPIIQEIDDTKYYCHWIKVYKSGQYVDTGSTVPNAGDEVSQLGYRYNMLSDYQAGTAWREAHPDDIARASAIMISAYKTIDAGVNGIKPPSYAQYQDIIDFNISSHRRTYIDADGAHFVGTLQAGTSIDPGVSIPVQIDTWTILPDTSIITLDENNNVSPSTITVKLLHNNGTTSSIETSLPSGKYLYVNGVNNNGLTITTSNYESASQLVNLTIELADANYPQGQIFDTTTINTFTIDAADGINGQYTQFAYKNSATQPSTPSTSTASLPSGWTSTPTTPSDTEYVWQIQRTVTFDSTNTKSYGAWSNPPINITSHNGIDGTNGTNGINGVNGSWYQNIYQVGEVPIPTTPVSQGANIPFGWYEEPERSPFENEFLWQSQRINTFDANNNIVWGNWCTAFRISGDNGESGKDGNGYEYIYHLTTTDSEPPMFTTYTDFPNAEILIDNDIVEFEIRKPDTGYNTSSNHVTMWKDLNNVRHSVNNDEYLPPSVQDTQNPLLLYTNWTDDPTGVNSNARWEWISQRKYNGEDGEWSEFSDPAIWSHYGKDGQNGQNGTNGTNGQNGVDGEFWVMIPLKKTFEVRIDLPDNKFEDITGAIYVDLAYGIQHIKGTSVNWLTTAEMAPYSVNLVTDNTVGRSAQGGITFDGNTINVNGTIIPVITYTKSNYLEYTANALSGNYIDYYYLARNGLTNRMPTRMIVELKKNGSKVTDDTINLIFNPDHQISETDAALDMIYQGLSGDPDGSYTSGFSLIKQQWDSINLSVNNLQQFAGGGFPDNTEYEEFAYWRRTTNTTPEKPVGDVTVTTAADGQWTMYQMEPSQSRKYVFFTKRTKPTDSFTHNTDQWSAWSTPVLFQVYGSNRGFVNSATLQITADSINSTVQTQSGQISQLQQTAGSLTSTVQTQGGQISTLQQTVNGFDGRIENVEGDIDTLELTTNGLSNTVQTQSGQISQLQQTAGSLTSTVQTQSGQISQLQQTAGNLTSTVQTQSGQISTLQQTATSLTSRIGNAEGNISELQQTERGLNYVVSNMQRIGSNEHPFPSDNEYEEYVYFKRTSASVPARPQGDITEDRDIDHAWTKYRLSADSTQKYVFISKRTKPTGSISHSTDSWSNWGYAMLWQVNGYQRGTQVTASLQIQADGISSTVQNQAGQISQISQDAEAISLKVDNINDGLDATGIDIEQGTITLSADNTVIGPSGIDGKFISDSTTAMNKLVIDSVNGGMKLYGPDSVDSHGDPTQNAQQKLITNIGYGTDSDSNARYGYAQFYDAKHPEYNATIDNETLYITDPYNTVNIGSSGISWHDNQSNSGSLEMSQLLFRRLRVAHPNDNWYDAKMTDEMITSNYDGAMSINLPDPLTSDGKFYFIKHKKDKNTNIRCTAAENRSENVIMNDDSTSTSWQINVQDNSTLIFCDGEHWILMELDY